MQANPTKKNEFLGNIFFLFFIVIVFGGCKQYAADQDESISGSELKDTQALRTAIAAVVRPKLGHDTTWSVERRPTPGCQNVPTTRVDLGGYKMFTKIFTGDKNAGISVPGFGDLKLGSKEISYNVYYLESKIVPCGKDTQVFGCGYSLHLLIKKLNKKIDVSKLPSIAASVQLESNKTSVYYSLETHGITGTILVKFFKPTVNKPFDVEGFGIMQASIDGIHAVLSDDSLSKQVRFIPIAVGFLKAKDLEN